MNRRTLGAGLATALLIGTLTACTPEPVDGQAFPDWEYLDKQGRERFDAQMALLDSTIVESAAFNGDSDVNVTGTSYSLAQFGDNSTANELRVMLRGDPISMFTQMDDSGSGETIDQLHLGGDEWDYLLLGDALADKAPTAWVRFPTVYGQLGILGEGAMCYVLGFSSVCEMREAITATEGSEQGAQMRRSVQVDDDGGVFSQTEVTLQSVIDAELIYLPEFITSVLTDEMRATLVPVNLWQDPDGELVKMEMNGVVRGSDDVPDLALQIGFEVTGTAKKKDFPAAPDPSLVTTLTEEEREAFVNSL